MLHCYHYQPPKVPQTINDVEGRQAPLKQTVVAAEYQNSVPQETTLAPMM